jgi:VWFA-related protein
MRDLRIWSNRCIAAGSLLFWGVGGLAAQEPTLRTRPADQLDREYRAAHRITLNVNVRDGSGKPVADLDAADFKVFDNNQPRKVSGVRLIDGKAMNDATEVLIVLDAVNSTTQELQQERQAIFNYLAHSRGPLPYPTGFALWFNGHMKAATATTDRNALGRAFVSLTKGMHSNACAASDTGVKQAANTGKEAFRLVSSNSSSNAFSDCERVHFRDSLSALDGLAQQQRAIGGRTILIWVGPGWPLLSEIPVERLSAATRSVLFDNVVDLLHDFREAQVTVDVVAPPDEAGEKQLSIFDVNSLGAGANSAQEARPANLALPVLATETGGRVLTTSHDMNADLLSCVRDADSYYTITFQQMRATSSHELHKVAVKVVRPGLDVRTLSAYYAEP